MTHLQLGDLDVPGVQHLRLMDGKHQLVEHVLDHGPHDLDTFGTQLVASIAAIGRILFDFASKDAPCGAAVDGIGLGILSRTG